MQREFRCYSKTRTVFISDETSVTTDVNVLRKCVYGRAAALRCSREKRCDRKLCNQIVILWICSIENILGWNPSPASSFMIEL